MHSLIVVIGETKHQCQNLIAQYDDGLEVKYDAENDYFYNPNGHYDWLTIGGRWRGYIKVPSTVDANDVYRFSFRPFPKDDEDYKSDDDNVKLVDGAYVKDVLNLNDVASCYGWVDLSGWHDKWSEGEYDIYENYVESLRETNDKDVVDKIHAQYAEDTKAFSERFREKLKEVLAQNKDKYILMYDVHE